MALLAGKSEDAEEDPGYSTVLGVFKAVKSSGQSQRVTPIAGKLEVAEGDSEYRKVPFRLHLVSIPYNKEMALIAGKCQDAEETLSTSSCQQVLSNDSDMRK